jgi:hypothetical protein
MQSPAMSFVETSVNVVTGYGLAVLVQLLVFPAFRLHVPFGESLIIGLVFTMVSMVRSYTLRRVFERIRIGGLQREAAALWGAAATIGLWVGQLPMR